MPLALVIEDEPEIAGFVVGAFRHLGFEAVAVESAADAIELIERSGNVVVAFVHLSKEAEQFDFVTTVAARWPSVKIIVLSSRSDDIRRLPPTIFIAKPTGASVVMAVIKRVAWELKTPRGFLH